MILLYFSVLFSPHPPRNNNLNGTKITVDILSDALNAGDGIHEYNLNGSSYTGNLPEPNYAYGNGTVYKRNKSAITVVLYGGTQEPIATNYSSDGKTWRGWKVHALKSDLEIETNDLTNSLNPNYYDPSGDKWLRIYRVGNIKFLSILFKAKDLTGHEVIATDIPTKLRPVMACYGVIQGRDTGEWVKATYVPVVLSVGRESLTISTGVNASKAVYITGMVCYV